MCITHERCERDSHRTERLETTHLGFDVVGVHIDLHAPRMPRPAGKGPRCCRSWEGRFSGRKDANPIVPVSDLPTKGSVDGSSCASRAERELEAPAPLSASICHPSKSAFSLH